MNGFFKTGVALLAAGAAVLLAGCGVPYAKDQGFGGYTDTSIEKNLYRVAFSSPGGLSVGAVHDLALLRAAEVVQDHDCAYFTVVKDNSGTTTRLSWLPDAGTPTFYTHPEWVPGMHGPRLVMVSDPYWDGPQAYPVPIPFTELYVRGYATRAAASGSPAYSVKEIIPKMREQYKLQQ